MGENDIAQQIADALRTALAPGYESIGMGAST
jgi:hypothetical protein